MKKVSILALILASFMLLTIAGAAYADATATEAPAADAAAATDAAPLYGQVTNVDENTITIALATLPVDETAAADATATEAPAVDATATEAPAADAAATEAPALALTGESTTVTVDDSTVITLKGADGAADTTGTMADIAVGELVTITLKDNTATAITVEPAAETEAAATAEEPAATEAPASNG